MHSINFDWFSICPLSEQDLDKYFDLVERNRSRLEDFFTGTVSKTKTREETAIFVKEITGKAAARTYFPFLLYDKKENTLAGFLDIKNIDWNIPKAELGFYMDKSYAGKGLGTKALKVFIDFCFDQYGFQKLFLRTHPANIAARAIAEKCGFEVEGTIRKDYKTTAGILVDLIYYGKVWDSSETK